jgi:hypothetical protein
MVFVGWVLSAFSFVIALAGLATPGAGKLISLALIGWCLIFLPPLWRRTIKYGLPVNIVVRVGAFFTLPVMFMTIATANGYRPEVSTVKTQPEASSISVSPTPVRTEPPNPLSERVTPKPATSSIAVDPTSTKVESPNPLSNSPTQKEIQPEVSPRRESLSINDLMQSGQLPDEKTTYTTSEEIEDLSTAIAKRFSRSIAIPPGRTHEEVRETFKRAMRDLLRERDADAATIWGSNQNNPQDSGYNVGMATYAPDGDWVKASSIEDRGQPKRVIIDFEASYFKRP